ncbi:C2H2 zinc finger protein [Cordyceps fumosorosea ARSEF 2679]|uniref:C2H2 zinc finger protein n=1 Tax=Cordyceps fumosorosea (strain ARSEF 2679) TaxID=1081104 RepID=A0A162K3T5_CORFA|nr:C2H2 zinc finger protein [Cordyceps fumosorosea ARSEF 2679]OAA52968.1 C2H2 zinc finger protein [Cordyceps fumosorosea ARSEF 2679]
MGNNNAKESRPPGVAQSHDGNRSGEARSRHRSGPGDVASFFGVGASGHRDRRQNVPFEHRETRQEREARRLERERAARLKERERSIREEHVDGGYVVTLGTYMGTEDFNKPVVRQLQIERRLAPFWRGLNDWSDSWAEHQLVAAARDLPIPKADEPPPPELMAQPQNRNASQGNLHNLTVPITERSMSTASDHSGSGTTSGVASPGTPTRGAIKPRAKALAKALTGHSRNASSAELPPTETMLPRDPFVNGQLLEVYLYKDAKECPICFLWFPPYLNSTRCCDQPICSECFVQIKRAEPHWREHHPDADGQAPQPTTEVSVEGVSEMLVSEPSACPYCQQPEFGVTYDPPPFRRGLVFSNSASNLASSSTMSPTSSQTSLHANTIPNPQPVPQNGRRRGHSLSANAPNVITTDRIRPDWSAKLATARAQQARRAAAATALHTAAFLADPSYRPSLQALNRRNTGTGSGSDTPRNGPMGAQGAEAGEFSDADRARHMPMQQLENMMFLEAIRLSLVAEQEREEREKKEQERQKKEEKALRKEAKKREQAEKKAAKKAAKNPYGGSLSGASGSSLSLGFGRKRGNSGASNLRIEATPQGASQGPKSDGQVDASSPKTHDDNVGDIHGKGKSVDRSEADASAEGSSSLAIPIRSGGSHLRQISNASSLGSSVVDSAPGSLSGTGFLHVDGIRQSRGEGSDGEESSEPMFNFRSLAELVGVNLDEGTVASDDVEGTSRRGPGDAAPETGARPLSRVKEEDEPVSSHEEKEVSTETTVNATERQESQRNLHAQGALRYSRSEDDKSCAPTVLIEDVAAPERK